MKRKETAEAEAEFGFETQTAHQSHFLIGTHPSNHCRDISHKTANVSPMVLQEKRSWVLQT